MSKHFFGDTALLTGRSLRHILRSPDTILTVAIMPIALMLLFVYVFGGAVSRSLPNGVTYIDFLLPGIFVQSVTFRASQTAVGLAEDLERGVIDRFRSMPMARSVTSWAEPLTHPHPRRSRPCGPGG